MPRFPASRSSGNYTRQPHARPPSTLIHQHHDECTICQARRGSSGGGNQSGQAQTARPTAPTRGRRYAQRWLISLKILYRVLTSHIYQQIIIKLDFRRIYFLSKTFNMASTTEPGPGYTVLPLVHCTPILDDTGNTHVSLLCLLCTRILLYISNCQRMPPPGQRRTTRKHNASSPKYGAYWVNLTIWFLKWKITPVNVSVVPLIPLNKLWSRHSVRKVVITKRMVAQR